jgi:hypothetical protein
MGWGSGSRSHTGSVSSSSAQIGVGGLALERAVKANNRPALLGRECSDAAKRAAFPIACPTALPRGSNPFWGNGFSRAECGPGTGRDRRPAAMDLGRHTFPDRRWTRPRRDSECSARDRSKLVHLSRRHRQTSSKSPSQGRRRDNGQGPRREVRPPILKPSIRSAPTRRGHRLHGSNRSHVGGARPHLRRRRSRTRDRAWTGRGGDRAPANLRDAAESLRNGWLRLLRGLGADGEAPSVGGAGPPSGGSRSEACIVEARRGGLTGEHGFTRAKEYTGRPGGDGRCRRETCRRKR